MNKHADGAAMNKNADGAAMNKNADGAAMNKNDDGAAMKQRLSEAFADHDGYLSDKWQHYIGIYERELGRFLDNERPVELLEIGVQNGGSLQVWARVLPSGSRIVGLDIDPACARLAMPDHVEVLIGDASDPDVLVRLLADRTFDVIIDDGSHRSPHVIATFEAMFGRLRDGGLYIIEDLHCSYLDAYGGGFRSPGSSIESLKNLVESLNFDHIHQGVGIGAAEQERMKRLNRAIGRISFYDSIAVVEKYLSPKETRFPRVMAGVDTPVGDPTRAICRAMPPAQLAELYLSVPANARFSNALTRSLAEAQASLAASRQEAARLAGLVDSLKAHVLHLEMTRPEKAPAERGGILSRATSLFRKD
jgi:cephalosporin hydroxylase